jgi:hypothetical protein
MRHALVFLGVMANLSSCGSAGPGDKPIEIGRIGSQRILVVPGIKENHEFFNPRVLIGDTEVFRDTSDTPYDLESKDNRMVLVPGHADKIYILLAAFDPPLADKWVVLELCRGTLVTKHVIIRQFFLDRKQQGATVVGGFENAEGYCTECDSSYYNPAQMYQLGETFAFDLPTSSQITEQVYGVYLGRQPLDTLLRVKKK